MADLNSQGLQQQIDDLQRSLNGLNNTVDKGDDLLTRELKARGMSAEKSNAVSQGLDKLGSSVTRLTAQIYKGEQGAEMMADAFANAAGAGGTLAFVMGNKVVKALSVLGIGLVQYGRAAAQMSDVLFKSYQGISRAGAAGADGLEGVFAQLQDFRLSLGEIEQLSQLYQQNAQALALFRGTVYEGAKSLGQLRKNVTATGLEREFLGLGMTTQEINESLGGFINLQSRLGIQQVRDNTRITASLNAYIQEQDAITKITGATRRQQEEAANKAMNIEQFRAKINELVAKGDLAEANRLMSIFKGLDAVSSDLSAAFASTVTGFVTEGSGVTGQLVAQGKFLEISNNRNIQLADAMGITADSVEGFMKGVGNAQASVGMFNQAFGANYSQLSDFVQIYKDAGHTFKTVEDVQRAQRAAAEKGLGAQVDLRTAQMNSMQSMQSFINFGVNPATRALAELARATEKLLSILPGAKPTGGYGQAGTGTLGGSLAATGAGAATGAAVGSVVPVIGTTIGAAVGGLLGYLGYEGFGGGTSQIKPEDVINFGTGTGSRQHFDQLQDHIKERALAMAYAYQQQTGQKLNLNSAFRSAEEQAALIARGGQGANPAAAPGNSLHQQGRILKGLFGRGLVACKGHVSDDHGQRRSTSNTGGVVADVIKAYWKCGGMTLNNHTQRVPHQEHVNTCLARHSGKRGVVAGQHGQLFASGVRGTNAVQGEGFA
jgi:hypothetical protein